MAVEGETPLRRVRFSIDSPVISIAQITSMMGFEPDRAVAVGQIPPGSVLRKPASCNTWEIVESGDDSSNVDEMLQRVYGRLGGRRETIRSLRDGGCTILVSVIQHIAPGDRLGPGFSLDFAMIEFMAFVGVELDIAQYLIE